MPENSELVKPGDDGVIIEPGSEVSAVVGAGHGRTVFSVGESDVSEEMLKMSEQTEYDNVIKAEAHFRKGRKLTFELIPDYIRGEEGKKFIRITSALAAVAATGAGVYLIIRKKSE